MFGYLKNKQMLITGGNGYIASNIINLIKNIDTKVIRFDKNGIDWVNFDKNGKINIQNIEGDVKDTNIWESLIKNVDIIIHLAAQTSTYIANSNPEFDIEINVLPMLRLLETCRQMKIKPTILYSGTVTEAGIQKKMPVNEEPKDKPVTIYDLHKLMSENYLKYYTRASLIKGAILRLSNVYGPGPKSSSADRGVLNLMIGKALNNEPITIYGKGNFIRDYIYVEDVARAFLYAAKNIEKIKGRHFVIGSGKGYSISQAFNLVSERVAIKTGKRVDVINIRPPDTLSPIEYRNFVADTAQFSSMTKWSANIDLANGIDITIDYLLSK